MEEKKIVTAKCGKYQTMKIETTKSDLEIQILAKKFGCQIISIEYVESEE